MTSYIKLIILLLLVFSSFIVSSQNICSIYNLLLDSAVSKSSNLYVELEDTSYTQIISLNNFKEIIKSNVIVDSSVYNLNESQAYAIYQPFLKESKKTNNFLTIINCRSSLLLNEGSISSNYKNYKIEENNVVNRSYALLLKFSNVSHINKKYYALVRLYWEQDYPRSYVYKVQAKLKKGKLIVLNSSFSKD